ncbi:hypothetical protein O7606_04290 [Micromonospora sp. WMMD882]|uniref:hypothetical protein n=1 Tax=Micromonospora sp. WMMD882 TaxID=3015151 RepID=UPI00248BA75A|nr:hypothetical protein [Micromonospora sp. WMMD882]WBB80617.1 hypothetical protein O7606_04290 [Micromonospora sp. WMMD882]
MSGISIIGFAVGGAQLATGLGTLLALDPAEAAARNERIRCLTQQRRSRREALEAALAQAADERERLAQTFVRARVDAAGAAAALTAAGLPPEPGLTPPVDAPAVADWCGTVPGLVAAAHRRAATALADQTARRLSALLAEVSGGPLVDAAEVLAPAPVGPTPTPAPELGAVVARMLSTLDPRADGTDRAGVEAVAATLARRSDRAAHLVELRLRVQEANDRAARRYDDAVTAAQVLDAMTPYRPGHGLDPDRLDAVRAALAEVAAFRRDLDDGLLDQVAGLRAQVESRASAASLTDAVADVLGELGYLVGPDFSVGEAAEGRLEISHPGRPDHLVRMRVDGDDRQLVAMMYRADGPGDAGADTSAEAAWCGDLDRAVGRLADAGLAFTPIVLTDPGARPVPAVPGRDADEQGRTSHRYRDQHRPERS